MSLTNVEDLERQLRYYRMALKHANNIHERHRIKKDIERISKELEYAKKEHDASLKHASNIVNFVRSQIS